MPWQGRYPPAHTQLLDLARVAREEGLSFDQFWQRAVRPGMSAMTWAKPEAERDPDAVVWPRDAADRAVAVAATLGAEEGWRRAYEEQPPTSSERALRRIAPTLDVIEAGLSPTPARGRSRAAA